MARQFTQQEVAKLIEAAVAPLRAEIAQLKSQVNNLHTEVTRLQTENARLKKDSSTSSKPPSSDIVKPPPLATCAQCGRSAFVYLSEAIAAYFRGQTAPSLLALPP